MLTLSRYPFFRILPAFVAGIIINDHNNRFVEPFWISLLFILVLFAILYQWPGRIPFNRFREALGIFIFMVFMICGYINPSVRHGFDAASCTLDSIDHYYSRVVRYRGHKNEYGQYVFNIKRIRRNGKWMPADENVLVYIDLNRSSGPIPVNAEVLVKGHPVQARSSLYEGLFDFRKYLKRNDISCIHYLNPNDLLITDYYGHHSLLSKIEALREHLTEKLHIMIPDHNESSLAVAMLLGDRSGLDTDLRNAYNAAGVAHILAVSGLHTGIIFMVFSALLWPLKLKRKFRRLYYLAIMAGIWFYAVLTGLSPSVIRASLMFSIVLLGLLTGDKQQVYNAIAAAAFFMLLFEPWLIYSVSFQLSFLAVFGIVVLYPKLKALIQPEKQLWKYTWKIICVSVAAQIALFPLLIYYFHQFSPFFIISNLLIIPAATLILTLGMALLAINSLGFSTPLLNHFFQLMLNLVNRLVVMIGSLPGSRVDGLYINTLEVWLFYLLLAFFVAFIYTRKKMLLVAIAIASVLAGFVFTGHIIHNHRQKAVVVYRQSGAIHADFIRGNTLFSYKYRNEHPEGSKSLSRADIPGGHEIYRVESIFHTNKIHTSPVYDLVVFEDKSFLFLKRPLHHFRKAVHVDYLFICTSPNDISAIPESLHFKYLVIPCQKDGSLTFLSPERKKKPWICLEQGRAFQIKL